MTSEEEVELVKKQCADTPLQLVIAKLYELHDQLIKYTLTAETKYLKIDPVLRSMWLSLSTNDKRSHEQDKHTLVEYKQLIDQAGKLLYSDDILSPPIVTREQLIVAIDALKVPVDNEYNKELSTRFG